MAVEKSLSPDAASITITQDDFEMGPDGLEVMEEISSDEASIVEGEDGSITVDFGSDTEMGMFSGS